MYWLHSHEVLVVGSGVGGEVGKVAGQFSRARKGLSVDEGMRGKHLCVASGSVNHGNHVEPGRLVLEFFCAENKTNLGLY